MGLDISYYSELVVDPTAAVDEEGNPEDWDNCHKFYRNPDFPGRADDIDPAVVYRGLMDGDFRAGSYGGYNQWRDALARLIGQPSAQAVWDSKEQSGPFFELIHFSDCEGTIGTAVSAKLAKDFQDWHDRAVAFSPKAHLYDDEDFIRKYKEWQTAFETAANRGCVCFH